MHICHLRHYEAGLTAKTASLKQRFQYKCIYWSNVEHIWAFLLDKWGTQEVIAIEADRNISQDSVPRYLQSNLQMPDLLYNFSITRKPFLGILSASKVFQMALSHHHEVNQSRKQPTQISKNMWDQDRRRSLVTGQRRIQQPNTIKSAFKVMPSRGQPTTLQSCG